MRDLLALAMAALLCGCGATVVEKPVMAPVDHPRPPKGITTPCDIDWEPITLPTTA